MAKFPKPYYRSQRKTWCVQIGDRQITLGPDRERAFAEYHRLMAAEGRPVAAARLTAADLMDLFLDHVKRHRKDSTYGWYLGHLDSFAGHSGRVQAGSLRPLHVTAWLDSHSTWGASFRRGAITAVKRCWAWAVEEGHLDANPIASMKRPPMGRRHGVTDEGLAKVVAAVRSPALRDFVAAMLETGCRPGELSGVEARDVAPGGGSMEVRNKLGQRSVILTAKASEIVARLSAASPAGPIFRNSRGRPWNRNSLRCAFRRLRAKTGVEGAVPYALRHAFGTAAIGRGVDSLLVAELMGHKDVKMLQQVYAHHREETLRRAAEKATRSGGGDGPPSGP